MKQISEDALISALKWRYATKAFDPSATVDPATWEALLQSLVLSPSSFGLQPWKFVIVSDPAKREALVPLSWGQRQVVDASHLVVFTVKSPLTADDVRRHIERTAEVQGTPREQFAGFEKMVVGFLNKPPYPLDLREWSTRQLYIALGNFMTSAAMLGVDTCPMEGIDPAGYDRVLGLEGTGYFTVAACPVGRRSDADKYSAAPKVRFPGDDVVHHVA
jgi:nitroreductase